MTEQPSKAAARFYELVRARRALLPRKQRNDREVYEIASLHQVLEQVSHERAAGLTHNDDDVRALIAFSQETVAAKREKEA
jgi:hypothetical protein